MFLVLCGYIYSVFYKSLVMCVSHSPLTIVALSISETSKGGYTSSWNVGEGLIFTCSINNSPPTACEKCLVIVNVSRHIKTWGCTCVFDGTVQGRMVSIYVGTEVCLCVCVCACVRVCVCVCVYMHDFLSLQHLLTNQ